MAAVALALLLGEGVRHREGQSLVLPGVEAPLEGGHVGVPHPAQGPRRQERTRHGSAVDGDRRRAIGDRLLHLELQEAPRDEHGLRKYALGNLLRLSDVEDLASAVVSQPGPELLRRHLGHLPARLLDQFPRTQSHLTCTPTAQAWAKIRPATQEYSRRASANQDGRRRMLPAMTWIWRWGTVCPPAEPTLT